VTVTAMRPKQPAPATRMKGRDKGRGMCNIGTLKHRATITA